LQPGDWFQWDSVILYHAYVTAVDRNTTLLVEAVEQSIDVDIIRSLGTVGVVSVDVVTQSGSAIGQVGPDLHLSHLQSVSRARGS